MTGQPSFESDWVNVELFDDIELVVHVLQQTQHLQIYEYDKFNIQQTFSS